MELKDRDDPDTLIDLYCYACDCFIVSCLVASVMLKEQCNEYHSVIMHYLSKKSLKLFWLACIAGSCHEHTTSFLCCMLFSVLRIHHLLDITICARSVSLFSLIAIINVVTPGS